MEYNQFSDAVPVVDKNQIYRPLPVDQTKYPPHDLPNLNPSSSEWVFNQDIELSGGTYFDNPEILAAAVMKPVFFKKGQVVKGYPDCPINAHCVPPIPIVVDIRDESNTGGIKVRVPREYLSPSNPSGSPDIFINPSQQPSTFKRLVPFFTIGIGIGFVVGIIIFSKK